MARLTRSDPRDDPRVALFSACVSALGAICSDGSSPIASETINAMAAAAPSTRRSSATSDVYGIDAGSSGSAASIRSLATSTPASPPSAQSTRHSVKSCAIRRPRLAPSAARSDISFMRVAPLASSRLAMLAHAMSSTSTTAPPAT